MKQYKTTYPIPVNIYFSEKFQALPLEEQRIYLYGKRLGRKMNAISFRAKHRQKRMQEIKNERQKKLDKIIVLREKGLTLEETGKLFGVTRERIRQLEIMAGLPLRGRVGHKGPRMKWVCQNPKCRKEMISTPSLVRRYCSVQCRKEVEPSMRKRLTLEEYRAYQNERTKKYYHEHLRGTERFKAITSERNHRYQEKTKLWRLKNRDKLNANMRRRYWHKRELLKNKLK